MKAGQFLDAIDDAAVVAAIAAAEQKTSGELRVFVARRAVPEPLPAAQAQFIRLKMDQTRQRNGVLIYIAPASRTFAVVGDTAIHDRCGQPLWDLTVENLSVAFRDNAFTQGLVQAIEQLGVLLAEHFPPTADDQNELPDRIERDS